MNSSTRLVPSLSRYYLAVHVVYVCYIRILVYQEGIVKVSCYLKVKRSFQSRDSKQYLSP